MKSGCEKWSEPLLEAALHGTMGPELADHVGNCADCSVEWKALQARAGRLEELLPMVAQGAEPSPEFRARVLGAARSTTGKATGRKWRVPLLAGATAAVVVVLVVGNFGRRGGAPGLSKEELAAAQKLAEWRAPSDGLLMTPGQEMLRTMPKLGKSYLDVPAKGNQEE